VITSAIATRERAGGDFRIELQRVKKVGTLNPATHAAKRQNVTLAPMTEPHGHLGMFARSKQSIHDETAPKPPSSRAVNVSRHNVSKYQRRGLVRPQRLDRHRHGLDATLSPRPKIIVRKNAMTRAFFPKSGL